MDCRALVCVLLALTIVASPAFAQRRQASGEGKPAFTLPPNAKVLHDVEYAKAGDVSVKLDLYLPPGIESAKTKPPLLVWIHGGGWRGGDKADCPLRWLVGEGYAVASINYRLSEVAKFPAGVHDCKGAIRWLRAHASEHGYNGERIGISGGSAGGHLVALLGVSADIKDLEGNVGGNLEQSSRVQAVVDFFGPTDVTKLYEQHHPEFTTSLVALWLDSPIVSAKAKAELASPAYHITPDDAPILIIQGTKDPLVMTEQSTAFHEAYKKAGLDSTIEIIEGGGHGGAQFFDARRRQMISEFFARHIKQAAKS